MNTPRRDDSDQISRSLARRAAPFVFIVFIIVALTIPILLLTIPHVDTELRPHSDVEIRQESEAETSTDYAREQHADFAQADDEDESSAREYFIASRPASEPFAIENTDADTASRTATPPTTKPVASDKSQPPATATTPKLRRTADERRKLIEQYGGSRNTENAVEAGVLWLAVHQSPDGTWDRFNFDRQCPPDDRCTHPALLRESDSLQAGITGLALLAILGAGYTDLEGPYRDNVRRAAAGLRKLQRSDGGFSPTDGQAGYNNSVATFALAELYALNGDETLVEPLNRAVAKLVSSQQLWGGWDYSPLASSGRNDSSITGWALQALLAARSAGIEVPGEALVGAAIHCARSTGDDGRTWYSDAGTGFSIDTTGRSQYRYGGPMTAIGLMSAQLLGWREDLPLLNAQSSLLLADPPSLDKARGGDPTQFHCEYYWYYGTVALFQRGGAAWERWNAALRDAILPAQDRSRTADGKRKHAYGSWPAYGHRWGKWARPAGRVYTTAICVLTLEVYYRHTPAYLEESGPLTSTDWRSALATSDERIKLAAIRPLRDARFEVGEPVLITLLNESPPSIAAAAAIALSEIDSPMGRDILERVYTKLEGRAQSDVMRAIHTCESLTRLPAVEGRVRLFNPALKLVTLELPRAYVGMRLSVWRGGAPAVPLRVVQRFTGRSVVVAELLQESVESPPRTGEMVRSE